MTPASWPREEPLEERLLLIDPRTGVLADRRIDDLPLLLAPGDLLVVNDAATLPASLHGHSAAGAPIELRLAGPADERDEWAAVVFGDGDHRTPTEHRPAPPPLAPGDAIDLGEDLRASVASVAPLSPRLVRIRFDRAGASLWQALYRRGRPVQYAYVRAPLRLWHVQTGYASRPWAVEPPSAGRPLRWSLLARLRARGVELASVTHAAGLSSTGDPAIDRALPLPERYDVPAATVRAVEATRARGGRVVAVGTSVVRALETVAAGAPLAGITHLRIGPEHQLRALDAILTGMHEPGSSHHDLMHAFAPAALLEAAHTHAVRHDYLAHEFGDSTLIYRSS